MESLAKNQAMLMTSMTQPQLSSQKKKFVQKRNIKRINITIIQIFKTVTSGLLPYNEEEFNKELVRDPFARDL